jgi:mRNA interferase RelE/StbE
MIYAVIVPKAVQKQIDALSDENLRDRIEDEIEALTENPRPDGVTKMKGSNSRYRIRIGNYRILYDINDGQLLVLVVQFGHRREVYRQLG